LGDRFGRFPGCMNVSASRLSLRAEESWVADGASRARL